MLNQRIYVSVVGFSDVERHALNTIFRLSEDRDVSYAPWVPLVAPGLPILLAAVVGAAWGWWVHDPDADAQANAPLPKAAP